MYLLYTLRYPLLYTLYFILLLERKSFQKLQLFLSKRGIWWDCMPLSKQYYSSTTNVYNFGPCIRKQSWITRLSLDTVFHIMVTFKYNLRERVRLPPMLSENEKFHEFSLCPKPFSRDLCFGASWIRMFAWLKHFCNKINILFHYHYHFHYHFSHKIVPPIGIYWVLSLAR